MKMMTRRVKDNFYMAISSMAMLSLFCHPSKMFVLVSLLLLGLILWLYNTDKSWVGSVQNLVEKKIKYYVIALILLMGGTTFVASWRSADISILIAGILGISKTTLLVLISLALGGIGFKSIYIIAGWLVNLAVPFVMGHLKEKSPAVMHKNLHENRFVPISAVMFFLLVMNNKLGYFLGILIAYKAIQILVSQIGSIKRTLIGDDIKYKIFYGLSAMGVAIASYQYSYEAVIFKSIKNEYLHFMMNILGVLLVVGAIPFLYICIKLFWKMFGDALIHHILTHKISIYEKSVYVFIWGVLFFYTAYCFQWTLAFYMGTNDIVYTSDSGNIVQNNAYLILTHGQNDLRQPLFAVFAAPFVSIPYFLGTVFNVSIPVQAMLLNAVQLGLLLLSNFLIAETMGLSSLRRIGFMIITVTTYSQMLFSITMEQYIFAYFWLSASLFCLVKTGKINKILLWGATGSLLISGLLFFFEKKDDLLSNFKEFLCDKIQLGIQFLFFIIICGRFDVLFHVVNDMIGFNNFAGGHTSLIERLYQYTIFIRNFFIAPTTRILWREGEPSWQLTTADDFSYIGIMLLLLSCISIFLYRHKLSNWLAFSWLILSMFVLVLLGWGTPENGLILYSLYFGWVFLVFMSQLLEWMEDQLKIPGLYFAGCVIGAICLLYINVPAMQALVEFAATYYPVK